MWHCLSGHSRWFSKTLYGALNLCWLPEVWVSPAIPDEKHYASKSLRCLQKQQPQHQTKAKVSKPQLPPITTCNWEILGVSKMHSICSLFKAYLRMFSEDCTSQLYRCSITHKWTLFLCSNSLEIVCSSLADLQGPRTRIPCFVCKRSRTFSGMGNRVAKVCIERVAAQ